MPLIAIEDLRVEKDGVVICDLPALTIDPGETIAIVGRNGSGKTTLLRVLAGLERDYRGTTRIAADTRNVVFVHQSPYLFRGTVMSNVTYGLRVRGRPRADCHRIGYQSLERCGAGQLADKTAAHLSGGERKRVALARAIAIQPELLLLDEPLEGVDSAGIATICQVLSELKGSTTVIVTSPAPLPPALPAKVVKLGPANSA